MRADELPPERLRDAADELLAMVRTRLPERFYREPRWRLFATAMIARMAGILKTLVKLTDGRRQADSAILVRALYEHMVTFAWILIDPEPRLLWWAEDGERELLKLHNDASTFGEGFLDATSVTRARAARELPKLIDQAQAVDAYWSSRVFGFRQNSASGPKELRTVRGLYVAVYRVASRFAHAQPQALDGNIDYDRYPNVVDFERDDRVLSSFLALPIFGMALLVCNARLRWPDDDSVRSIGEALLHDVEELEAP